MSIRSFDNYSVKQSDKRSKNSRKQNSRVQTPSLYVKSKKTLKADESSIQSLPHIDQDQTIEPFNRTAADLAPPSMGGDDITICADEKTQVEVQQPDKASDRSTAESAISGFSGQVLIPPENFRRCISDDPQTLMFENDRLRYIIQTLNMKWQMSGPCIKIGELTNQVAELLAALDQSKRQNENLMAENKSLKEQLASSDEKIGTLNVNIGKRDTIIKKQKTIKDQLDKQITKLDSVVEMQNKEINMYKHNFNAKTKQYDKLLGKLDCYIAHKDDITDKALAKEINQYPEKEKMKILFLRESEGVYKFGSKQVHVKIGKNKNVKVKVGGGFMSVSQFIEKYTDVEQQKMQRASVISRFQNKLKMQQVCSEMSSNMTETIPINVPQTAPFITPQPTPTRRKTTKQSLVGSTLKSNISTKASERMSTKIFAQ